jgi:hypothetical protein
MNATEQDRSPVSINQKQLAERWNISAKTLERWRWAGEGPRFLKLGGRVVYRLADVEGFEEAQLRSRTDLPARHTSSTPPGNADPARSTMRGAADPVRRIGGQAGT